MFEFVFECIYNIRDRICDRICAYTHTYYDRCNALKSKAK